MENLLKFYIDGKWVDPISGDHMSVLNPSNLEELGKVALGNEKDVNIAVEAAKRAFETYSKTTKDRLLLKELFVTEKRFEDLAQAMRQEWPPQFQWHVQLKLMQPLDI